MLPSRIEPNIRPNSLAELRRSPNFGPSLIGDYGINALLYVLKEAVEWESFISVGSWFRAYVAAAADMQLNKEDAL